MRILILITLLFTLQMSILGQDQNPAYEMIDKLPEFPGGEDARINYLEKNLRYPLISFLCRAEGTLYVTFTIDSTGKVTEVSVLRGFGDDFCKREAVKIIKNMPDWTPAEKEGVPINITMNMPVKFVYDPQDFSPLKQTEKYFKKPLLNMVHGNYPKCVKLLDELLLEHPDSHEGYLFKGIAYNAQTEYNLACEAWKTAEKLGNKDAAYFIDKRCK